MSRFKFTAFSAKQKKVLCWWMSRRKDCDGIIADGAVRSGKTVSMALSFVTWAMENFDGQNFLICGKTVGSCRRNVIKPLKQMMAGHFQYTDRRSDNVVTIRRGDVENDFYIFGGKDESSQDLIVGITAAGLLCDEVALMPESFVDQATARCSVDGSKWWFNCNPREPGHWFKRRWIDRAKERNLIYLHFGLDDNLSLTEKIKARLRSQYTGVFYERYILGKWALAEGLIYPQYQNIVKEPPENAVYTDWCISIDYGTQNAFAAILWAYHKGVWYGLKEYYWSGRDRGMQKTDEEYGEDLDNFVRDLMGPREAEYTENARKGDLYASLPQIETIVDPSAASFIALLRKKRWYHVRKADNDVINGIRETATAMKMGLIAITPNMKSWQKEAAGYVWDTKAGEDRPVKINDHAMDATRYMVRTKKILKRARNADVSGFAEIE